MTEDLPLDHPQDNETAQNAQAELERMALIEMRAQLQAFLNSPAGVMLRDRAQAQKEVALAELVKCDPNNADRIRFFQAVVHRVDSFTDWLMDLLYAGEQAADSPDAADPRQ